MDLILQPVRVASGEDGEAMLVFREQVLVAVLVRLSGIHGDDAGCWFLEAGFGALSGPQHPTFQDLDEARAWISAQIADMSGGSPWP